MPKSTEAGATPAAARLHAGAASAAARLDAGAASAAAQALAEFACGLRYEDIPADVIGRAKDCIIDTVGVAMFGARFPWSGIVAGYAQRYGEGGPCSLLGFPQARLHAPYAALANGAFAHAYEQDSLREPGAGVHPGASLVPAVLASCEESNADGKAAITAFVAGCEVLFRIGAATHHSSEKLGFHAPGLTGPYGAAVAAGRIYGLSARQMTDALGIAGSLSSGLLAFSKSARGAMVKRLHLGRASESGILAARLAGDGYEGPETVLEGKFGFLEAYARDAEPALLTAGLGTQWETLRICLKRYPCHITAHMPVQALRESMAEHAFTGADIVGIDIAGSAKLLTHHNILEPVDIMQAQYSVPFCVALAAFRDPDDPRAFDATVVADPQIRALCRNVRLSVRAKAAGAWSSEITVRLRSGRHFTREAATCKGMPGSPFTPDELRRKFLMLAASLEESQGIALHERLRSVESQKAFSVRCD